MPVTCTVSIFGMLLYVFFLPVGGAGIKFVAKTQVTVQKMPTKLRARVQSHYHDTTSLLWQICWTIMGKLIRSDRFLWITFVRLTLKILYTKFGGDWTKFVEEVVKNMF